MNSNQWDNDKAFWVTVINAVILILGMIRGVPVSPAVQTKIDGTAVHAESAAKTAADTNTKVADVQKQTKATASKVGVVDKE